MSSTASRIVFAASPEFALPCLEALSASGHELVAVLTQPDRPAGRGRALRPSPVKQRALELGLPVQQPRTLKDPSAKAALAALRPDLVVVVAYGLLLPPAVLGLPARGCVNVHASLLPRWRGASPIQAAILAGDTTTGVCLMQMDEGLDTGPVYAHVATAIGEEETAGALHDRLAALGAALLAENLDDLLAGSLEARPQSAEGASYAPRIDKRDGEIDWRRPAAEIHRMVRAYQPWPAAATTLRGEALRVLAARCADDAAQGEPGQVLAAGEQGIEVATGDGVLRLVRVQRAGRRALDAADFARGADIVGEVLGN